MRDELRCPFCESTQTRHQIKTGERICYSCGKTYSYGKVGDKDGS